MNPSPRRLVPHGLTDCMAALSASLLLLPTVTLRANQSDHGFNEFLSSARAENHALPYFDADPDSYYTPVISRPTASRHSLADLFSTGRAGASSPGKSGAASAGGGGRSSGAADNLKSGANKNDKPDGLAADDSSHPDFLLNLADHPSEAADRPAPAWTADDRPGNAPWTAAASLGDTIHSGQASDFGPNLPVDQFVPTGPLSALETPIAALAASVPETLPALALLAPLLAAVVMHRRSRRSTAQRSGALVPSL